MNDPRFGIGDTVTIPGGHGKESGLTGTITAIKDHAVGRFYHVDVPSPRSDSGHVSVPVLVQYLDTLSARPTWAPDQMSPQPG